MSRTGSWVVIAGVATGVVAISGTARAQAAANPQPASLEQVLQLKESRYQIGQIERLLEGAVEHGAGMIRDRLVAIMPADVTPTDMLLTENARARGFRLEGYGVFFDVEVPSLVGTLPWSFRTLDQNDLGVDNALQTIRAFIQSNGTKDVALRQALESLELRLVPPSGTSNAAAAPTTARVSTQSVPPAQSSQVAQGARAQVANDPILANPNEAYRAAIRSSLVEAMLEHTRGLNLGPNEWLTVAARGSDDQLRLASAGTEGQTNILSIRGSDLAAFLAGQITLEEAEKRVDIRVF
ncbi:MAG TPA: hypothetical protein VF456_20360 [Vicinamibacterales bacterium]